MSKLKVIWKNFNKYKYMLVELTKKGVKLKYRRSYLGIVWTLIEPLLTTIVLTFVFGTLLNRGDQSYPVYILTGRLLYSFFSSGTSGAMKSIRSNQGMIKKVYVPKYMYPLSVVLYNYVIFIISMLVLIGLCIFEHITPTVKVFVCILPLIILPVMVIGIGLILSTLNVFFRDIEYIWSVFTMLIMYASAIFYHAEDVIGKHPEKAYVFKLNPLYDLIAVFRQGVFGEEIHWMYLLYATCFSLVTLGIGTVMFYKQQDKFILHL